MKNRMIAVILLTAMLCAPAAAHADTSVADEATLAAALAADTAVTFTGNITTAGDLTVPANVVVKLENFTWTVAGGTVAVAGVVTGGSLLAAGGTIRVPLAVALENVDGTETIRSVTYQDGSTDNAASYVSGLTISAGGSASLYVRTASGLTPKPLQRVTTNAGSYRLGSSASRLSRIYSITYDLDGGSVAQGANPTDYTASDAAFTLANPTKEGFLFAGWIGTGLSAPTASVTVAEGSTGARSFTATWDEDPAAQRGQGGGSRGSGLLSAAASAGTAAAAESETPAEPADSVSGSGTETRRRVSLASSSTKVAFSDDTDPFDAMNKLVAEDAAQKSGPRFPWLLLGLVAVVAGGSGLLLHRHTKKKR